MHTTERLGRKSLIAVVFAMLAMGVLMAGCAQPAPAATIPPPTETPQPVERGIVEIEIEWQSCDGEIESADIYLPEGVGGNLPTVLFLHARGGPFGRSYDGLGRELARNGYASVMAMTRGQIPGRADALCALAWLRDNAQEYGLDPENIAVLGHMGGAVPALWLTTVDNVEEEIGHCPHALPEGWRPQALLTYAGIHLTPDDFDLPGWREGIAQGFGVAPETIDKAAEELRQVPARKWPEEGALSSDALPIAQWTPLYGIDGSEPPTLLVGAGKGWAPTSSCEFVAEQLRQAGVDATVVVVDGAGDQTIAAEGSAEFDEIAETVLAFLDRVLDHGGE